MEEKKNQKIIFFSLIFVLQNVPFNRLNPRFVAFFSKLSSHVECMSVC